jgi:ATP-binding cassette subfamily C (CFTR/MRP) protein 4
LILSYLLQNVGLCQWAVRQSAEVENLMVSTERVLEYANLESEAAEISETRPFEAWPNAGKIEFKEMSLKYPRGETVLKSISFDIQPGEKIGIVGRTGAGKSSLIQGLFRLVEPHPTESIVIDGIPISKLGLLDLRSRLTIIPQEPFLFKGTLRFNLDPFGHYSDADLWRALYFVELKQVVESSNQKLELAVDENGSNWSVGERQLICLARAILRNSKVVIMDEATSNVDIRTDACIQKAIRDSSEGIFSNATILTIAHRLNTVIDYDRILVLEDGNVVEFGTPRELVNKDIKQEDAYFSRMVGELDEDLQALLKRLIK